MLKNTLLALGAVCCSLATTPALAEFAYSGEGTLTYPTGTQKPFEFGFAFKQGDEGHYFEVGGQKISTTEVPEKYSLWLNLHKDEHVWVQEFARGYFKEFDWKIGKHNVKLYKKVFESKRAKGDYVLAIDGVDYYFSNPNAQIQFNFNETGIESIETNGFVKGIGVKK